MRSFNSSGFVLVVMLMRSAFGQPLPDTLWTRTISGPGTDYVLAVQTENSAGYLAAGWYGCDPDSGCGWVSHIDAEGSITWTIELPHSVFFSIERADSESFILAGRSGATQSPSRKAYVVKINNIGDTLWSRTYQLGPTSQARSAIRTADGGYAVCGYMQSGGDSTRDAFLLKLTTTGDTSWVRTYGGPAEDAFSNVIQLLDSGYVLFGGTKSFGGGQLVYWLLRTNDRGDSLWSRTYASEYREVPAAVLPTEDGGFLLVGWANPPNPADNAAYLVKTDSNGDTLWTRRYGSNLETAAVTFSDYGAYILTGAWQGYICLMAVSTNGDSLWARSFQQIVGDISTGYSIARSMDGGYLMGGDRYLMPQQAYDMLLVRTGPDQWQGVGSPNPPRGLSPSWCEVTITPNPFNNTAIISLLLKRTENLTVNLYDTLGREVSTLANGEFSAGQHTLVLQGTYLSSGIYMLRVSGKVDTLAKKVLLIK